MSTIKKIMTNQYQRFQVLNTGILSLSTLIFKKLIIQITNPKKSEKIQMNTESLLPADIFILSASAIVSPEQRNGNKAQHNPDQQTDLYSFDEKANGQP